MTQVGLQLITETLNRYLNQSIQASFPFPAKKWFRFYVPIKKRAAIIVIYRGFLGNRIRFSDYRMSPGLDIANMRTLYFRKCICDNVSEASNSIGRCLDFFHDNKITHPGGFSLSGNFRLTNWKHNMGPYAGCQ